MKTPSVSVTVKKLGMFFIRHKSAWVTLVPLRFNWFIGRFVPVRYVFQPNWRKSFTPCNVKLGLSDKSNFIIVDGNVTPFKVVIWLCDKFRCSNPSGNITPSKVVIWLRDKFRSCNFSGNFTPSKVVRRFLDKSRLSKRNCGFMCLMQCLYNACRKKNARREIIWNKTRCSATQCRQCLAPGPRGSSPASPDTRSTSWQRPDSC